MKPTLRYKPNDYAYQNLKMKFADGAPLTCDQMRFLDWHARALSNPTMDSVMKYYLKHYRHPYTDQHSFLAPDQKMDTEYVKRLKTRLSILLSNHASPIELKLTPEAFLQFRALTIDELILYHGNQLLTGAPFYPGGIPQLIFFQWGNLFGVAKYVVLAEERALKSNVLIYFEDLAERELVVCVNQYIKHHQDELTEQLHQENSFYHTPTLTLSPDRRKSDDESQ